MVLFQEGLQDWLILQPVMIYMQSNDYIKCLRQLQATPPQVFHLELILQVNLKNQNEEYWTTKFHPRASLKTPKQ